jgi:hypothetical protein
VRCSILTFRMWLRRWLRHLPTVGIATLMLSYCSFELVCILYANWRHFDRESYIDYAQASWVVIFGVWALLLTLRD